MLYNIIFTNDIWLKYDLCEPIRFPQFDNTNYPGKCSTCYHQALPILLTTSSSANCLFARTILRTLLLNTGTFRSLIHLVFDSKHHPNLYYIFREIFPCCTIENDLNSKRLISTILPGMLYVSLRILLIVDILMVDKPPDVQHIEVM